MQNRFNIQSAPPLRAEPRAFAGHVKGVDATSGGLIRAAFGAGLAAAVILGLFYMPAEYGVDPTGIGGLLGLTEMGEIKQGLYAEAAAEDAILNAQIAGVQPVAGGDVVARLDRIDAQLAAIAAITGADELLLTGPAVPAAGAETETAPEAASNAESEPAVAAPEVAAIEEPVVSAADPNGSAPAAGWRDEISYTLAPGEGIEVKLAMDEGQTAQFEWTANGSVVNYETHGDGGGQKVSYEQGRATPDQTGELTAAFTGNHGWFWRNRTEVPVTVTLRTAGEYAEMKAP